MCTVRTLETRKNTQSGKLIIVHTPDSRPYAKFAIKFVLGYQSNLPPPKSLNENNQRSKATPSKLIIFGEVIVIPLHLAQSKPILCWFQ